MYENQNVDVTSTLSGNKILKINRGLGAPEREKFKDAIDVTKDILKMSVAFLDGNKRENISNNYENDQFEKMVSSAFNFSQKAISDSSFSEKSQNYYHNL